MSDLEDFRQFFARHGVACESRPCGPDAEYGTDLVLVPRDGEGDREAHAKFEFDETGRFLSHATWVEGRKGKGRR